MKTKKKISAMMSLFLIVFQIFFILGEAKKYQIHDRVPVVANTVGPYNNPTETYAVCPTVLSLRHICPNLVAIVL